MAATIPQLVQSVGSPVAGQKYNKTTTFEEIAYWLTQRDDLGLCLSSIMFTGPQKTLQV